MNKRNFLPDTVSANLDARLAPFRSTDSRPALEDLDVEVSRAVSPHLSPGQVRAPGSGVVREIKLLFAALGAGGGVIPLGDNRRAARQLSKYAASLCH